MTATALKAEVRDELVREIRNLVAHGPDYLERYVDAVLERRVARPGPGKLHGMSAKLIREIVADAMVGRG